MTDNLVAWVSASWTHEPEHQGFVADATTLSSRRLVEMPSAMTSPEKDNKVSSLTRGSRLTAALRQMHFQIDTGRLSLLRRHAAPVAVVRKWGGGGCALLGGKDNNNSLPVRAHNISCGLGNLDWDTLGMLHRSLCPPGHGEGQRGCGGTATYILIAQVLVLWMRWTCWLSMGSCLLKIPAGVSFGLTRASGKEVVTY
jgi:hypothetical protein